MYRKSESRIYLYFSESKRTDKMIEGLWSIIFSWLQMLASNIVSTQGIAIVSGIIVALVRCLWQFITKTNKKIIAEEKRITLETTQNTPPSAPISIVTWRIWNCGGEPIEKSLHQHDLTFIFGPPSRVVGKEILETKPPGLKMGLPPLNQYTSPSGEDIVTLAPMLLNKGSSVTLKIRVENADDKNMLASINFHGNNVINVSEERKKSARKSEILFFSFLVLLIPWVLTYIGRFTNPHLPVIYSIVFAFLCVCVATSSVIYCISALAPR